MSRFEYDYDPIEDERAELKAEAAWQRSYDRKLINHPSCNDPDHPGCSLCMEEDDDD